MLLMICHTPPSGRATDCGDVACSMGASVSMGRTGDGSGVILEKPLRGGARCGTVGGRETWRGLFPIADGGGDAD